MLKGSCVHEEVVLSIFPVDVETNSFGFGVLVAESELLGGRTSAGSRSVAKEFHFALYLGQVTIIFDFRWSKTTAAKQKALCKVPRVHVSTELLCSSNYLC